MKRQPAAHLTLEEVNLSAVARLINGYLKVGSGQ